LALFDVMSLHLTVDVAVFDLISPHLTEGLRNYERFQVKSLNWDLSNIKLGVTHIAKTIIICNIKGINNILEIENAASFIASECKLNRAHLNITTFLVYKHM